MMKKSILVVLSLISIVSYGQSGKKYLEGFFFGMPKEEAKELVVKKTEAGLYNRNMGSKRHVVLQDHSFQSSINKEVYIGLVFKFVGSPKTLQYIEVVPFTAGSQVFAGFSRKKATILKREVEDYFEAQGWEVDFDLQKVSHGYFNTYIIKGDIDLDSHFPEQTGNFR